MKCWPRLIFLICFLILAGCSESSPQVAPPQPITVPVSQTVERQVQDFVDFTGRTDAVQSVNVVARVTEIRANAPASVIQIQ